MIEDLLAAYNYNKLEIETPKIYTKGSLREETLVMDALRDLFVGTGAEEVQTFTLTDPDYFEEMGIRVPLRITNPVTRTFSAFRPAILPHLLKVLSKNTGIPYPQKIFEIGEVFDEGWGYRVAYLEASRETSYTTVRQVLEFVSRKMERSLEFREGRHPLFIEGRTAEVIYKGEKVGYIGEIKPEILSKLRIYMPAAGFEVKLSAFLR